MKKLIFILLNFYAVIGNAQDFLPSSDHPIINHSHYSLGYDENHEQAAWVYYLLTKEELNAPFERSDRFLEDPLISSGSANSEDYAGSGYDRGHLAPAADMAFSEVAMKESFYYSNMSPQAPSFNRGIWKVLEGQVRAWVSENDSLFVVVGPVLQNHLSFIGPNQVSIPKFYYKIIVDLDKEHIAALAFLMPNKKSSLPLSNFLVSVDSVEQVTGIDFFAQLEDSLETALESSIDTSFWNWDAKLMPVKSVIPVSTNQCLGITKSGKRCLNATRTSIGFCHLHEKQISNGKRLEAVQCFGTTTSGNRCKRTTKNKSGKCYQHE